MIESRPNPIHRVLGYASVDPDAEESLNREFQRQMDRIAAECDRRGLSLLEVVRERKPKRGHVLGRPGLGYALRRITDGEAAGLVVAELSRFSSSLPELGPALEWFLRSDVRFIVAAGGLDTDENAGRLAIRTLIEVSRVEHERLAERTRKGMSAARLKGPRRVADNPKLSAGIARMRAEGMTLQAIADRLNEDGVPTVRGGAAWRPSSVQAATGYHRPSASDAGDERLANEVHI